MLVVNMISVTCFANVGHMESMGDRLRKSRVAAGFPSATKAAEAIGAGISTYRAHENGQNNFSPEEAERYAKRFGVTAAFLLTGAVDKLRPRSIPVMGYLGAGSEVEPDYEQVPPEGLETVELPFFLNEDLIAFRVKGISMLPYYKPDTVIIVYREQRRPLNAFYGEEAAVRTSDGRRFIKTIMRGERGVNLISWNAQPIENVHLEWIGEIFATLPASSVRKVERAGGLQGQLRLRSTG